MTWYRSASITQVTKDYCDETLPPPYWHGGGRLKSNSHPGNFPKVLVGVPLCATPSSLVQKIGNLMHHENCTTGEQLTVLGTVYVKTAGMNVIDLL